MNTTTQNDPATQPDDIDRESVPEDEFADRLIEVLEEKPAQITGEVMDAIERNWRDTMTERRCALIMLTEPWSDLRKKVEDDRGFAEAVANTLKCVDGPINACKDTLECLEASKRWMGVALACRADMVELMESAKQEVQS